MVVNSADKKLLDYFMNEESYTIAHDFLNFAIDDDIFDMFKNTIIITNPYLNQFKNSLTNENKERFDSVCFHSAKNIISLSSEEHTIIQDNNIVSIFKLIPFSFKLRLTCSSIFITMPGNLFGSLLTYTAKLILFFFSKS